MGLNFAKVNCKPCTLHAFKLNCISTGCASIAGVSSEAWLLEGAAWPWVVGCGSWGRLSNTSATVRVASSGLQGIKAMNSSPSNRTSRQFMVGAHDAAMVEATRTLQRQTTRHAGISIVLGILKRIVSEKKGAPDNTRTPLEWPPSDEAVYSFTALHLQRCAHAPHALNTPRAGESDFYLSLKPSWQPLHAAPTPLNATFKSSNLPVFTAAFNFNDSARSLSCAALNLA